MARRTVLVKSILNEWGRIYFWMNVLEVMSGLLIDDNTMWGTNCSLLYTFFTVLNGKILNWIVHLCSSKIINIFPLKSQVLTNPPCPRTRVYVSTSQAWTNNNSSSIEYCPSQPLISSGFVVPVPELLQSITAGGCIHFFNREFGSLFCKAENITNIVNALWVLE